MRDEKLKRNVNLSEFETWLLYLLITELKFTTAEELSQMLGYSEAHIRQTLLDLRRIGLTGFTYPLRGITESIPKFKDLDPRTKIHYPTITLEELREISPEYVSKIEKLKKLGSEENH